MEGSNPSAIRLEELVWRVAERHPEAIALERPPGLREPEAERAQMSYHALAQRAQAVALGLVDRLGAEGDETPVVVLALARDQLDAYVALLATLSAGAAYLALDESLPLERALMMIEDARPALMICDPEQRADWDERQAHAMWRPQLCTLTELEGEPSVTRTLRSHSATSLAYLIYTSGSTGTPKGVMIEHRSVTPLLLDDLEVFDLGPGDRVLQGSSHAYDSSVEEMFMAWSAGATVVIGSDETMRLGPDLGPWLKRERLSLIAPPPTLLRAIGGAREVRALTDLRYVYVGGEALPLDLAQLWSSHATLVNGYGPTECSVTATRAWITPEDREITIGHPHPGARVYIVDESLCALPCGAQGELLIGGAALARGYLRRPELTKERFPTHPEWGRVYRTGDLVSQREDGALRFHGRIDAQVKLRGYRLELSEVEVHVSALPGVRDAACVVAGEGALRRLVAFYVPDERGAEEALELSPLRDRLPHYMVPSQSVAISSVPRLMSGKVDRKALEAHPALLRGEEAQTEENLRAQLEVYLSALQRCDVADEALSERVASLIGYVLGEPAPAVGGDFFELGGDSITAAALISHLREVPSLSALAVRDVYELRSAEGLAERARELARGSRAEVEAKPIRALPSGSGRRMTRAGVAQALWIILSGGGNLLLFGALYYALAPSLSHSLSAAVLTLCGLWLIAPFTPLLWLTPSVWWAQLVKRTLIGRYESGEFPVWGARYVRHWLTLRAARLIPWGAISGSPLQVWALRALGAQIGEGVYLHRGVDLSHGGWDLIHIGDQVTLGRDASLSPVEFERHWMRWGEVRLGAGASVGIRGSLSAGSALGERSWLTDHGALHEGVQVPSDTKVSGARAERREPLEPLEPLEYGGGLGLSERAYLWRFHRAQVVTGWLMSLPGLALSLALLGVLNAYELEASALLLSPLETLSRLAPLSGAGLVTLMVVVSFVSLLSWLVYLGLLCRWRGAVPLGRYPVRSPAMIRAWQKERLIIAANRWLSGTLLWPRWLRLAGMKIGPDTEISTIMECVPEHTTIEGSCFSADGIYFAAPSIQDGWVEFAKTRFEREVFLGNHAVIPAGVTLPQGCLIGVSTVYEPALGAGSYFGNPAFQLPRRELITVDEALTHRPSLLRYVNRAFWELSRGLIPGLLSVELVAWLTLIPPFKVDAFERLELTSLCALGLWTLAFALANVALVCALKWGLLGKVKAGHHPLWSCWCSRWDFVYVCWGELARPALSLLEGSPLMNVAVRCFGVQVGARVFLGRGFAQVVDPDMLRFEDDTTVVNLFQAHSFEDRVLKTAPVHFREGSSVGAGTVVLYGAEIGEGSVVRERSVVMKGERLNPNTLYEGAPSVSR